MVLGNLTGLPASSSPVGRDDNGLPLGLLAAGSLIDLIGYTATATLYAASGLALMLLIALHWREDLWHLQAPANAR